MESWVFLLTAASAVAAALAAIASLLQVRAAAQAVEVDTFLRLADDYKAEEMRNAISALAAFRRDSIQDFPDVADAYEERDVKIPKVRACCAVTRELSLRISEPPRDSTTSGSSLGVCLNC